MSKGIKTSIVMWASLNKRQARMGVWSIITQEDINQEEAGAGVSLINHSHNEGELFAQT